MTATVAPAPGSAGAAIMSRRQINLVVVGLLAGMFLAALDQTIVSTAIRTIGDDLQGLDQQAWVTTAYLITSTISTPIYGKLSDILGRRPLFLIAIGIFVAGSVLAAFADSMPMLAAFRAVQGLGAGGLMSLPLAIMGDILAPRERAKYQGLFLAVFGVSSVVGPLIGGVFAGADQLLWIAGWRWVFLVNVPIGIVALAVVFAFLHLPRFSRDSASIDWWGALAVILALVPLLVVAEQGREWGWTSPAALACFAIGAAGLVAFLLIERRLGENALIPLGLFRSRVFSVATVLGVLVGFGMFGALMTLPLYLQIVLGLSPTESGFALLPVVLGMMVAALLSGQLISRTGKYRFFPLSGAAFMAAGFLLLSFTTLDRPFWFLVAAMLLVGLGLGQLMQTLVLASQNAVEAKDMGVATSTATFFRQIGGTIGTAVLLSLLFSVLPVNVTATLADEQELATALDAALDPAVADDPANAAIFETLWTPLVQPLQQQVQAGLDEASAQVQQQVTAAVTEQVTAVVAGEVAAGTAPAAAQQRLVDEQIAAALPAAIEQGLQAAAAGSGAQLTDGRLVIDYADAQARAAVVERAAPELAAAIAERGGAGSTSAASDTSFLHGADPRLARPFLLAFTESTVLLYRVAFFVVLAAFVLAWFFRPPALRKVSALQARADEAAAAARVGAEHR